MALSKSHQYSRVGEGYDEGETNAYLERLAYRCNQSSAWDLNLLIIFPWLLAAIFGALSLVLWIRWPVPSSLGSYELGFTTDVRDFGHGSTVPLEKVQFTGNLFFPGNKTSQEPWRRPNDELAGPKYKQYFGEYTGTPSQEIDNNWETLTNGRYISVSEEEASGVWGDKLSQYMDEKLGGYTAGLDVFHTLHCLNFLRQGLFPEYYSRQPSYEIHRDHCIDILRQAIQCCGSTTLIPTMFMNGLHRKSIDSDQVHTCRSFDFILEWTKQRGVRGNLYVERKTASTDESKN